MLDLAARLALRGAGHVEPNPLVGAVLVREDTIIGMGHHRRFGGAHAEREALADCLRRGHDPRGSTLYVTLEPCRHVGKTPPCTEAIIAAGVTRVVAARRDPGPVSGGGARVLQAAGIACQFSDASPLACAVSAPFVKRVTTGLPWVIAKWAQYADGRMVSRAGEGRWITSSRARRRVHRLRGLVDAIVTGIGTVLTDDPLLTVREARARRQPVRVVLDTHLRTPESAAVVQTARDVPTIVVCGEPAAVTSRADRLRRHGVEIVPLPQTTGRADPRAAMRCLVATRNITSVLIEAGPSLIRALLAADLPDQAFVHVAPSRTDAPPPTPAEQAPDLATDPRWIRCRVKRLGHEVEIAWMRRR